MNVALVQSSLVWENPSANRQSLSAKIDGLINVDLIVLPEMFTTGFTMNPEPIAEEMDGETLKWMTDIAKEKNAAVCGSVVISENGNFYNRFLFVYPTGEVKYYDKRHLFTLAGEHNQYTPGVDKIIIDFNGFRICPLVCYDLRFPVFTRNTDDYDLLIFVANWPEPRVSAWVALLKARAIENMSFVIGVNRVGADENGNRYVGHSQVIDALGNPLTEISEDETVIIANLNKNTVLDARQKFGFLNDRDEFTVV